MVCCDNNPYLHFQHPLHRVYGGSDHLIRRSIGVFTIAFCLMAGNPAKFLGMSNRKSESYIPGTRRGFATRYSASRKKLSYTQPSASLGAEEGLESFWTPRLRRVFELRGGVLIGNATRVLREAAGRYGDNKAVELCDQILAQTRLRVVYPMAHITWGTKTYELPNGLWESPEIPWGYISVPRCCDVVQSIIGTQADFLCEFKQLDVGIRGVETAIEGLELLAGRRNKSKFLARVDMPSQLNPPIPKNSGTICQVCHQHLRLASRYRPAYLKKFNFTDPTGQVHSFAWGRCRCGLNDEEKLYQKGLEDGLISPVSPPKPLQSRLEKDSGDADEGIGLWAPEEGEELVSVENAKIGVRVQRSSQWRECDGEEDGGEGCVGEIMGITTPDGVTTGLDASIICNEKGWRECCVVRWEANGRIDGYPIGDRGQYVLKLAGGNELEDT